MKNNALLQQKEIENIVKETITEVQLFDNSNNHAYEKSPATRVSEEGRQRELEEWRSSDIAIIGISGKFADSPNVEAFWRNLKAGTCCVKPIRRKDWETHTSSELGEAYNWGGMLESIDQFDPLFFNISPLEAARMDPQQRIFLHEAYKSFEDAGYSAEQLSDKKVGVFVGARSSDYQEQALLRSNGVLHLSELDSHLFLGNDMAILAARISYFLNLKGPSLTIDTASSSSLVAIHLACESIRAGEAEMALAGGVFAMSSPAFYAMAAKTQMLSPDGKCKAFDKSANGIVIGEGVGALVLKPLASALEDGDHIYGVIKGSAINQDGRTKGITAPNMLSQKDLLVSVYKKSAIDPETISYIEAHGTGSKLGDPIEVQALTEAFKTFTDKKQFCAIGSHKANFGHTIVSAGIASVFKVLLSMKYEKLPPTLNIEEINPQIDLQGSPFFINTELRTWKSHDGGKPRRAGISSFGLSGTNCHLILEEPPPHKARVRQQISPYAFFPLSARTKAALKQKVVDLIAWLKKEGEEYAIEDISYTLVQGRSHFSFRLAVVARDAKELLHILTENMKKDDMEHDVANEKGKSSQMEPLLHPYGNWLLKELQENAALGLEEYKEKIVALADLYMRGYSLDWSILFKKEKYHRVPLPTYPFSGESYWISERIPRYAQHLQNTNPDLQRELPVHSLHKVLKQIVSDLLRVNVEEIDADTQLTEYGFDSITFMEFAKRLNQSYQLDLTAPLFYEHSTIGRLARYLQATYTPVLAPYFAETASRIVTRQDLKPKPIGMDETSATEVVGTHRDDEQVQSSATSPIAIIGISACLPQAHDVQSLWNNLLEGKDCISQIPSSRWDWRSYFGNPATEVNKTNVKWAGIVEDVELFDPLFFGISPREAEQMDPQQRLLMMYVWKAIEDAGYSAESLSGSNTALFIGSMSSGYYERLTRANVTIEGYSATGQAPSVGPNRVSYFLNLHGPSEAIETACSSSLVAIHRGVNAIESGQCEMAIVGGVNTLVSPELHISYSKAGMLCEDGRCKTFSAQANGYVRAEGVGVLVLKKLSDAEQANDHIYGIIRGSAENHGGRTSSLTAPNPRAQADLLIAAYRKAGIDPHTVGYIEAHGTGTPLGDPIEINGLKMAFSELSQATGNRPMSPASCGIGSLKSNIGHLEWASGVAGVIKVLLQMRHKQLVKSLHCEQINPYIQLEGSPFYVVQQNCEWEPQRDSSGNVLPRRAGVSSFGFGGANAHVVLEEYIPGRQETEGKHHSSESAASICHPAVQIVLSARNEERLHEQVQQLLTWLQAEPNQEEVPSLQDLAYTLQVGRTAMEERLALQVSSLAELEEKLRKYLQGPQEEGDWYRGQVKRHKEMVALLSSDEELQEAIGKWLQRGKYEKLLEWWVKGLKIDWKLLYTVRGGQERGPVSMATALPRRISLPTYPFARERYWLPAPSVGDRPTVQGTASTVPALTIHSQGGRTPSYTVLHPLVQYNNSTLREQRFFSIFYGDEFFLADHVVKGQRVLPAVAYLEMVRVAVVLAAEVDTQIPISLHDVVWIQPLVVGEQALQVHIKLSLNEDSTISYEIVSRPEVGNAKAVVHCQGRAALGRDSKRPQVDLAAIQAQSHHQISISDCYATYQAMGIEYGPTFQALEQLYVGEEQLLARLSLPSALIETLDLWSCRGESDRLRMADALRSSTGYALHPSMVDGALQASVGFLIGIATSTSGAVGAIPYGGQGLPLSSPLATQKPVLPFALEAVHIHAPCQSTMWALLRLRNGESREGKGQKIDIDVCDERGQVCVRLIGFSSRVLEGTLSKKSTPSSVLGNDHSEETRMLMPVWEAIAVTPIQPPFMSMTSTAIIGGTAEEQEALQLHAPNSQITNVHATDSITTIVDKLAGYGPIEHVVWIAPPPPTASIVSDAMIAAQNQGVLFCFRTIKALLQLGYGNKKLIWSVITRQAQPIHTRDLVNPAHASIHGLIGSLAKGYPNWSIRLIDLEADGAWPLPELFALPPDPQGNARVYRAHEWYQQQFRAACVSVGEELAPVRASTAPLSYACPQGQSLERCGYRSGGIYVVIGGAGGIGEIWSEYMIRRYQAQVIWIGRRKIDAGILAKQERLAALGPRPYYITADASELLALQRAYDDILRNFGRIHGVVHSAIVLLDQSLASMDEERFRAALAAKVDVSVRLAQVFEQEPLDFVLFFSSIHAFLRPAGQSNYAAGCTFEDAFAARLGRDWPCAVKVMNWGYWGSVGVVASPEYRERMARAGFGSIEPTEAMEALEVLLSSPMDQCVFLKTTRAQALGDINTSVAVGRDSARHLSGAWPPTTLPAKKSEKGKQGADITDQMVKDHVQSILLESIAEVLKVDERIIEVDTNFSTYGVDSIVAVNLINVINEKCGLTLQTTVLFDHNNVKQLLQYIVQKHEETLRTMLQENTTCLSGDKLPSSTVSPTAPTYQRVIIKGPGGIDDLTIGEASMPELNAYEVRIAVHAFSLNFGDLLCVKGLYPTMPPYPFTPGFEASGVVLDVGRAVTAFQTGDPVFALAGASLGGQASAMICPEEHVFHKPAALSFEEACALPVVAITMIAAFEKARLKPGEKILIQTATGGTGLIAIQLAKHYGAQIYATAGSQSKLDYLKRLAVPYRIDYQETDFEKEIERITAGKGVDVVINTLSGDAIQKGMNCLSVGGRYIEIAMTALKSARTIDLSVLSQNQTFYSVDLRRLAQTDPASLRDYCHKMLQLVEEGIITATIGRIFAWERLKEAYRYMEDRQHIGKIVVRVPQAKQVSQRGLEMRSPALPYPRVKRVSAESLPSTIPPLHHEPIAIIGVSGRFAHSKNVNELWEHLANGTDLVEEVTRWDLAELSPEADEKKEPYCKRGSFLEGIDLFDPLFFNISGLEATYMDPQQRLVLEEAWTALEDAGYAGISIEGHVCGVYMGCSAGDYQQLFKDVPPAQAFWGNANSVIPARIAYFLNLQGPAIAIDTACSSSLVAIHLACQGLRSGEIDMALAGGIFLQCTPQFYQSANRAGMLSSTGRCSTFDDRADGFVPGEGVGIVVLKRLKEALASGDHIYAVIRGSGTNQDGATRGITVPSANSQERLMRSVYEMFQVEPSQIQMIEAHGTGTKLGDPIEYEALTRTFRRYTEKKEYCALGSIKTNLGHTATAAGIAGVIRILLSLQHKQIPPSLHFESGNAHIQFKESPFYVNTRLQEWEVETGETCRRAAISSFGFSGTNAHMVIEEAPEHSRRHAQKPGYLIVLSARTAEQLRQQAEQLVAFCERNADGDCGNMSHTLLLGRKHLSHRLACVVRDHKELETLLRKWLEKGRVPQVSVSNLENRELREDASLKRYGNQCIQDCRQSAGTVGKRTGAVETAFTPVHSLTPETYLELLVTVAELYVQGYTLAFEQLFVGEEYSRISLPTYPFARERYWIPSLSVGVSSHGSESTPRLRSQSLSAPVNDPSGDTLTLVPVREAIAVASVPSVVHSLQRRIPDQKEYIKSVQGEVGQKLQEMDKMLGRVLWVQLQTCGWFTKPQIAIADLKAQVGLPTRYNRWLNETITVFAQRKYLSYDVHSDTVADPISIDSNQAWREWEQQKTVWLADPDLLAWAVLVETSLRALPEVLAGRVPATDILFPHASMELVEGIYKDNRLADLFNGVLADVVVAYLYERSALDEAVRLRILEIGAGTGGTSALIFQKLLPYQEYIQEYCYTDLSQAFLWHAQQAYGPQNPYLTYRIFNVEKPIADQGMSPGSYDLVVATNVLHATRSLRQTLRNAKALLKRHGLLLINELTHKSLLLHVAFGLLDGWWLHEDQALRLPGCPFLTPDRWQVVLEQEGFQQLFFPTAKTDQLDQQIIVAENDGIVRQPHTQQADRVSHQNVEAIKQRSQSQSERRVDGQERRESARLLSNQPIQSQSPHIPIDALRQELSHIVSHLLNVPIEEISAETALSEYGFDSISFTGFARRLNQTYELDLAPPLFYEYSTIERLAQYLQTTYASVLAPHFTGESLEIVPRKDLTSDTVSPSEASSTVEVSPITTHVSGQQLRIAHSQTNSLEQEQPTTVVPIAIIGVSGSFPQAPDVQSLWDNLLEGKDCISEIPPSRWDWRTYFGNPEASPNKTNVKWAGVIEDIEQFDPLFFGISPSEAEQMDPQQRLLMMYVWKAIEDAGYKASSLSGTNTALFVGTANSGYGERISRANGAIEGYFSTGQAQSIGPNRMSYFLNLHGPSEMIDTACSSSLVAIHRGVSVIESGVCSMAIVGGVNTLVSPNTHISLSKTGMLSPDGRCKTFSVEANGFVRSEGVGILVLKKLSDAEQSGDHIYGVIRGSAENHGGRASSLTAPNPRAQADLLIAAYRKAGIDPRTVNYIEAHGTGTELGDPIEINGLKTAWNELMTDFTGNEEAWCGIGSVKSNIGHLELAAGVTGVIKVLLQMQHKKLVKSLHCEQINPYIKLKGSPFYIMQETRDWEAQRDHAGNILPRRAGVSSFGFGGTNAHVVLEEYIPRPQETNRDDRASPPAIIVLSAKNEERLREQVQQLRTWINGKNGSHCGDPVQARQLQDLAYTLQVGREAMEERLALQVSSLAELEEKLGKYLQEPQKMGGWYRGQVRRHDVISDFAADEVGQQAVTAWMNRGQYEKLLAWWVKGLTVDWKHLYGEHPPRRISLPTYPFARERYWLPIETGLATPSTHNTITFEANAQVALDELEIRGQVPTRGWARVRHRSIGTGMAPTHTSTSVFDIELYDDEGRVVVVLRGLSTRPLPALPEEEPQTVLLTPSWQEESIMSAHPSQKALLPSGGTVPSNLIVLLCDLTGIEASSIQAQLVEGGICRQLSSQQPRREQRFQDVVLQLLQVLQSLLRSLPTGPVLVQVVVAQREEPSMFEALTGVLKTAQQEYPQLAGQLIEIEGEPEEGQLLAWLAENQERPEDAHIRYRGGKRWVKEWQEGHTGELASPTSPPHMPWKEGRCYLITGGAGGLAKLFVQEIARQVREANIVLVGRSALSQEQQAQLFAACGQPQGSLVGEKRGINIDYQQVDVSDESAVHALMQRVLEKSGHLDGIIHAAGTLRDSLLLHKTPEDVQAVLQPKVIGVELLDKASMQIPLDFFVLCSSISAVMGNVGQADYAAANAYLDAFAHTRQAQVLKGLRHGTTVSINWPFWDAGGMQIGAETVQMMRERMGIEPMGTETGMKALYQALTGGNTQVVVLHGQVERIKQQWLRRSPTPLMEAVPGPLALEEQENQAVTAMEQEALRERASAYFKKQLATFIKLPAQQIEMEAPLSDYGFDSIMAVGFTSALEGSFGPLSKTLLYEYPTVRSVTDYFLHRYPEQLRRVLGIEEATVTALPQVTRGRMAASIASSQAAETQPGLAPHHRPALLRKGTTPFHANGPSADEHARQDKQTRGNEIAIIGVAGRYPGARDLREFWENLRTGRDSITEIPPERWDHRLYWKPDKNQSGTTYSKWGGFLDGVDEFDPLFFNISPRDAEMMHPQERLFLECAFATLEDAGYTRAEGSPRSTGTSQNNGVSSNVGVFVGVMYEEYQLFGAQAQIQGRPVALSGSLSSIANRVSYVCNFHGPSLAVDTMCSSSLTAIHLACESISNGDCALAIAGGVNVSIHPNKYLLLSQGQFVSSKGSCQSFGVGANGYVPGEGVGAVLLKPLWQAEADGDHIYAVIRATAINHGGKTNGYSVPNPHAQADVVGQALKNAGIDPRTISYIEAHGTGTKLGDPIEIAGLTRAFANLGRAPETQEKHYCAIGSVKSNIGHAESAAGIAGVTKVLLQMQNGQLVPSLHAEVLNPHIDFSATPFVVQRELSEWKRPQIAVAGGRQEVPRRAGVSSFGAGGSNAHVILEEYIGGADRERNRASLRPALIVLSARTAKRLQEQAQQLLAWIEEACTEEDLDNLAYTLQVGREAMEERLALQVSSLAELSEKLGEYVEGKMEASYWYRGRVRRYYDTVSIFAADEDGQKAIAAWMSKGKYGKLLEFWVNGGAVDWRGLYGEHLPHRISLPTYPFARERYWIPTVAVGKSSTAALVETHSSSPTTDEVSPREELHTGSLDQTQTRLLTPGWIEVGSVGEDDVGEANSPASPPAKRLVLLCDLPDTLASHIQAQLGSGGRCRNLATSQIRRAWRFQDMMVQLIQELQSLRQARPAGQVQLQVVVAHREESSLLEALTVVLKVAQQEYPKIWGQLVEVDGEPEAGELLAWLHESRCLWPYEPHIRYRDGKRWVRAWQEFYAGEAASSPLHVGGSPGTMPTRSDELAASPALPTLPSKVPWKEGGCYLITGGAGGLGRLFVQEIARHVETATVILVGRSALSQEVLPHLEAGGSSGIGIDYQQVDVSDEAAVHALIERVLSTSGRLDGIIHAAGVIHNNRIVGKTQEEVRAVLAPKVMGVEHLDEASSQLPLDFFLLCSSLSAVLGGVGYVDYAGANAYLDAFAHERAARVLAGERQGKTLSINWPYWQAGGMQAEAETIAMMREMVGEESMGTETGMATLYQALAADDVQVAVLHGQVERIKQHLQYRFPAERVGTGRGQVTSSPSPIPVGLEQDRGQGAAVPMDKLRDALVHMVSDLLKVQVEQIDVEVDLSDYGFDSITFIQFANRLNQSYQLELTPTLFYEYSTIESLACYLQKTYAAVLTPHFAVASPATSGRIQENFEPSGGTECAPKEGSSSAHALVQVSGQQADTGTGPIAIIGMSGAFPQAPDVQSLWSNLLAGRDCIGEVPLSRWDWQAYMGNPDSPDNPIASMKWAGVMEEAELFDPQFFGISPREAEQMDPQQRLLMMYVWKAIEDAGYAASSFSGSNTALFVGTASSGYSERVFQAGMEIEGSSTTGLMPSMGPGRMSYFLDLHGPSEAIDTACSSSLVAIHRGVNAIEHGACNVAIVGGVNTLASPKWQIGASKAGMLSEDGRCKTFGAGANGYVRGEGVGILVLKKLVDAEQAGDHIYGVIRGSAENHGGRATSLTAPNPRAQADLLIAACRKAGIDPRTVGYIEAHGTGTALGDPIEINGLKAAFSELMTGSPMGNEEAWCGIGSVKSNIGHLELAAGVAGVIKVLLQMQHKKLVKSLHCEQINPYIQLAGSPFYIVQEMREWEAPQDRNGNPLPRRAGVSSFGFGGVNAHVVLEEYIPKPVTARLESGTLPAAIIVLSAKNEERLQEQARQLLSWVQAGRAHLTASQGGVMVGVGGPCVDLVPVNTPNLRDLAYTLQVGREAMEERLALQVNSLQELEEKLNRYLQKPQDKGYWYRGQVRRYKEVLAILGDDEELQGAISKWLQRGKYEKLLNLWVNGGTIDWKRLYGEDLPHRISLPTYPFARERYWISPPGVEVEVVPHISGVSHTGNGTDPMITRKVALKPLADSPVLLDKGSRPGQALSLRPLSAGLRGTDQPKPSTSGISPLAAQDMQAPMTNKQTVFPIRTGATQSKIPTALALEEELVRSLVKMLYMEESAIDVEKPFVEMGLDSVIGVEWIQSLNKQYALNLKASSVYDYPTIRQLADFLEKYLCKQQQTTIQSVATLSLDDLIQKVQKGDLEFKEANNLFKSYFSRDMHI